MDNELRRFLSSLHVFTPEETDELEAALTVKEVRKNEVLVRQGQICQQCFFVLKGCLRQYIIADGIEKTTAFYTEDQAVNFFSSYTSQTASESFLSALEDTVVLAGNPEKDKELYARFPKLAELTRKMMETDFGKTQDQLTRFITSSPEERYLYLLENNPGLIQRVPQHQLANYLGVAPESLSRIKKRLYKK